jgi:t-SNARE complex subunit (syntaxin)
MSKNKKLQGRISELQAKVTQLESALNDEVGNQEVLGVTLRNTQAQLEKVKQQMSEKKVGPI